MLPHVHRGASIRSRHCMESVVYISGPAWEDSSKYCSRRSSTCTILGCKLDFLKSV